MESLPADFFVTSMQFTKHVYRDQYPAIDPSSSELSLAGKTVIITGASRGLGAKGLVPSFARAGVKAMVLVSRNADAMNAVAAEVSKLNSGIKTSVIATDISNDAAVKALYDNITAEYGHADILVNNAGLHKAHGTIQEIDPALWWDDFSLNSKGTFLMTTHFLKQLPSTAHGTIISLTSGMAYGVYPGNSAYSLGKLINLQMATLVAAESPNVTSVALHPGVVMTDMTAPEFRKFALDTPELVGGVAVWLSTEKARFMNGRYMNSNWSVDDLYEKREEIQSSKLLQIDLQGTFGAEHFTN